MYYARGVGVVLCRRASGLWSFSSGRTATHNVILSAARELAVSSLFSICDVSISDEVNACVASVVEALDTVDILVTTQLMPWLASLCRTPTTSSS